MVIEHSFVTTMPCREALSAASAMLTQGGFVAETQGAFGVDETQWTSIQMQRGKKTVVKAKDASECPQRIRMDWDRGRVTVAASIEPKIRSQSFYFRGFSGGALATSSLTAKAGKRTKDYSDLMIAIVLGIDGLLVARETPETASQAWYALETELKAKAKKARVRSWIILGIFLAVVIAFIVFVVIMANSH